MDIGWKQQYVGVMYLEYEGVPVYFIDNEYYFNGFNIFIRLFQGFVQNRFAEKTNAVVCAYYCANHRTVLFLNSDYLLKNLKSKSKKVLTKQILSTIILTIKINL